jgi:xanthine dehydrogenase accessory factor
MVLTDLDVLLKAEQWKRDGRRLALATLVETWGSAPCPAGSHLVVDSEGNFHGSVSGGCVEGEVIAESEEVIASGNPKLLKFGVKTETAWRAGLACGGHVTVYLEPLVESDGAKRLSNLSVVNAERGLRRPVVLVSDIETGEQRVVRESDFSMDELADEIASLVAHRRSGLVDWRGRPQFLNVMTPTVMLVIVGAGRISQALAGLASFAGLDIAVVDPRAAFATAERFPGKQIIVDWPDAAFPRLGLDRHMAVACLTHDRKVDDIALELALKAQCAYVGALGSRKSHAARLHRLRARGLGADMLSRIRAPIGLDIGASDAMEIAVSILGEIFLETRRKPLRETQRAGVTELA